MQYSSSISLSSSMPALVGSGLFHTCFDTPYNELVHTFHLARDSTSEPSRSESSLFFPDMSGAPDKRSRSMAGVTANSISFVLILLLCLERTSMTAGGPSLCGPRNARC